jgi:hypothetical protein
MRLAIPLVAALAFSGAAAQEKEDRSTRSVLPHCVSASATPDPIGGRCAGIIATLSFVSRVLPDNLKFCHPNAATPEQIVEVITKFVETNPDAAEQDFRLVALAAMRNKWPCEE